MEPLVARPLEPAFDLGTIYASAEVDAWLRSATGPEAFSRSTFVSEVLSWHSSGCWGDLDPIDLDRNDESLAAGGRLIGRWTRPTGDWETLWIVTDEDRTATTVFFPHEFG